MILRDYQTDAVRLTYQRLEQGYRPIVCAPTGSGKTIIAGQFAKDYMEQGKRILFLSGRQEILRQTFDVFNEFCGTGNVGFLMGQEGPWWFYPKVTVGSWDTLKSRWSRSDVWKLPVDVVLLDECHLALSKKMSETVLPYYQDQTVIGFTATPARQSGKGLGEFFTRIIQVQSVQQIIDNGYLAPCEYWAGSHADVSKVRTINGDFEKKGLSDAANDNVLIGDVIDNWLRLASGRHTIVFAVDIAHAQALTERFQAVGISAEVVHSKMTPHHRASLTNQFKQRKFEVLVNVGIATYGYDVPSVSCVVLARPTKSIVLHLQMIGRGMRPKEDGGYCMILDHADNVRRLGCAEDEIRWSLDGRKKAFKNTTREGDKTRDKKPEIPPTTCGKCSYLFSRSRVCPKCGWEKPVASADIETVDADLVKIRKSRKQLELEGLDRRKWFLMARGWCFQHGKKPGMAYYRYRDKFGEDPDPHWSKQPSIDPDRRVDAYMRSSLIRYAKRKRNERPSDQPPAF